MRLRDLASTSLLLSLLLGVRGLAQEPASREGAAPTGNAESAPPRQAEPQKGDAEPQKERVLAIRAGYVHPIAGPAIQDGVVLVRGDRIVAVGKADTVEIPADAEVQAFPQAHVYPGLVDAMNNAFLDDGVRGDGSLDAGSAMADAVQRRGDREDELVRAGITTAYVSTRNGQPWAGIGAIVRPRQDGVQVFAGHERGAVAMLLAAPPEGTHALDRQQAIDGAFGAFAGLDGYKKQFDEHKKALEKYSKEFADYLAWHEKKNGTKTDGGDKAEAAPAATPATGPAGGDAGPGQRGPGARGGRGRRGGGDGGGGGGGPTPQQPQPEKPQPEKQPEKPQPEKPQPEKPQPEKPQNPDKPAPEKQNPEKPAEKPAEPKPAQQKPEEPKQGAPAGDKPADAKPEEKPPERPKYPKAPSRDPSKDALLDVLDGKLPLRVFCVRADEIRAVLAAAQRHKVPVVVLEGAYAAADLAGEIATAQAPCVLTDVWPLAMPRAFADLDPTQLPAQLQRAGVPFAISSGNGRTAAALPMMAACAVGNGLDADAALRAITLSAAEILGVQRDVGSLQTGKLADVLVCDRPLLQSDCRVLAVWSAGENQFLAKEPR